MHEQNYNVCMCVYLVQIQRQQQQYQYVTDSHAAQVQVGTAPHVGSQPNHKNCQYISQQTENHQENVNDGHTH